MEINSIYQITQIILTAIGLLLVIVGWLIPYRTNLKVNQKLLEDEKEFEVMKWKKAQIDSQISKLYGPIYAILLESDIRFKRILHQLGRSTVFGKDEGIDSLSEEEKKIWIHYVEEYKVKRQMEIVSIIENNFHLIYKQDIPKCFSHFLDYSIGWDLLENQKRKKIPNHYEYSYAFNFPKDFSSYIRGTLELLLKEQAELMGNRNNENVKMLEDLNNIVI